MSGLFVFIGVATVVGIAILDLKILLTSIGLTGCVAAVIILSNLAIESLVSPLKGIRRVSYSCSCGCSAVVDVSSRIVRCDNCVRIVSYEVWNQPRSISEG